MHDTIVPVFATGKLPHYLMDLSEKEVSNMKHIGIKLRGIIINKDTTKGPILSSYSSVQYQCNIQPCINNQSNIVFDSMVDKKEIQLCKIRLRYLIITIDKNE